MKRLRKEKEKFLQECRLESVESAYPGMFSLTQLAYGSKASDIEKSIESYRQFIKCLSLSQPTEI